MAGEDPDDTGVSVWREAERPVAEVLAVEDVNEKNREEFMPTETRWLFRGAVLGVLLVLLLAPSPYGPPLPRVHTAELHPPLWTLGLSLSLSLCLSLSLSPLSLSALQISHFLYIIYI